MRLIRWLLRSKDRRLEVSTGGSWYILFTIVLGAVAINSGNNVIYLLESLLLSSLIYSGVMSEFTISNVFCNRVMRQAIAGEAVEDILVVENKSRFPLFCIEVGEWVEGRFLPLGFILRIPGRTQLKVKSQQTLARRGIHSWESMAVATKFPFGFARKIKVQGGPGARIIWPAPLEDSYSQTDSQRGEWAPSEGELEEVQRWEDVSRVHWPSSGRSERLLARKRQKISEDQVAILELSAGGVEWENRISRASYQLQQHARALVLHINGEVIRVNGAWPALDTIAVLPASES